MKTLLQIVQEFTRRAALAIPATVVGNTDSQVVQMLAILNEELDDLVSTKNWPVLQLRASLVSLATEDQGAMTTIAPGFKSLIPKTFWSTTKRLPAIGSISPVDSQYLEIWIKSTAFVNFRQVGGHLKFIPAIAAGQTFSFEYRSQNAILDVDGITTKQYFVTDTDIPLLEDIILLAALRWRWRAAKGLDYSELYDSYQKLVAQSYINAKESQKLSMADDVREIRPGIIVPFGNIAGY